MRLKRVAEFDESVCAVARCDAPSILIDSTGRLAPGRVPLCEGHWVQRIDELEAEPADAAEAAAPSPPLSQPDVDRRQMPLPL